MESVERFDKETREAKGEESENKTTFLSMFFLTEMQRFARIYYNW